MKWRLAAALACAVVLPGSPAHSAPLCRLVVDEIRDSEKEYVESLDLTSADIASDSTVVTAVLRVARLNSLELGSPTGVAYSLTFDTGGTRVKFMGSRSPDGEVFEVWIEQPLPGQSAPAGKMVERVAIVSGEFLEDLGEVRVHAPVSALRQHADFRPGSKVSRLHAVSWHKTGTAGSPLGPGEMAVAYTDPNDEAVSTRAYPAGARSCVIPGR